MFGFKHGRLGSAGTRTLIQRAIASLRARGTDAHLWLPGVGTLSGLQTGNYLESTGNTLATVDNPTGLVLDALGTVGVELVTNGGFDSDTGWTKEASWAIGSGVASKTAGVAGSIYQGAPAGLAQNTYCRVTFTATRTAGTCYFFLRDTDSTLAVNASGTYSVMVKAGANSAYGINIYAAADFAGTIDNISVREVSGIHLTQGTTANKPVLRRGLTNLLTYSSDFSNAAWQRNNTTVTPNATTNSSGALSAAKIVSSVASGNLRIYNGGITVAAGATATMAKIAKKEEFKYECLSINSGSNHAYATFDLDAGTVSTSGVLGTGVLASASIVALANGWYLISVSGSIPTITSYYAMAYLQTSSTGTPNNTVVGDGTSGVYAESAGLFLGSYTSQQILAAGGIPVTTTAAASNPDAGKYSWAFDSTDVLSATIPAGWETATIIDAAPTGAMASVQNVVGTHSIRGAMVTGVNLVTNGDFSNGATGWTNNATGVVTTNGNTLTITGDQITRPYVSTPITCSIGKTYSYTSSYINGNAQAWLIIANSAGGSSGPIGPENLPIGTYTLSFIATQTTHYVVLQPSNNTGTSWATFDNISVYEINPVTHARILVKGTLTAAETDLYKSLANSFK